MLDTRPRNLGPYRRCRAGNLDARRNQLLACGNDRSNLNDTFNQLFDVAAGKDNSCIQLAGNVLGTLADLSGGVGINLIGTPFSQDDELQQVLQAIRDLFNQLETLILAEDKLERMRNIDSIIDPAFRVFRQLPAILSSRPPTKEFILDQIGTCEAAMLSLASEDNTWRVVMVELPSYSDSWSGTVAPQAAADPLTSGGLVFNYTYTLSQFLRAIYIFLTVVGALDPSPLDDYRQDLNDCVTRLQSVHDTTVSGIVKTRMPTVEDVGIYVPPSPDGGAFGYSSNWYYKVPSVDGLPAWLYGAVEVYSAASKVSNYYYYFPYAADLTYSTPQAQSNFIALLQLRIIQQQKALYNQLGMPVVRQVINQLRLLTGQPLLTDASCGEWTVGEVFSILGLPLPKRSGVRSGLALPDLSAIEAALAAFLQETPPYTSFWVSGAPVESLPLPRGSLYTFLTGASDEPTRIMKLL